MCILDAGKHLYALAETENVFRAGDISEEDFSSSYTIPVPLDEYNAGVARHARRLAQALCLQAEHVESAG